MEWIAVALIGALIGWGTSLLADASKSRQVLFGLIGALGAAVGGALARGLQVDVFGPLSFFVGGACVASLFSLAGLLPHRLTGDERRV